MKNVFLAWGGTIFLGVVGAAAFFRKNIQKILKALKVARDILDIIDEGVESTEDGKLSTEELERISYLFNKLKLDLKGEK